MVVEAVPLWRACRDAAGRPRYRADGRIIELAPGPGVGLHYVAPEVEFRPLSIYQRSVRRWPMSLQSERLLNHMQGLRLTHLPNCYEAIAEEASVKDLPYLEFLEQALEAESQAKHTPERAAENAVGSLSL